MKISIVGNGFDIRHNLKTKFSDYMSYYKDKYGKSNVIINYFEEVEIADGWLDFEKELQMFFIYLGRLNANLTVNINLPFHIIVLESFMCDTNSVIFFDTIRDMGYDIFMSNEKLWRYEPSTRGVPFPIPSRTLAVDNTNWFSRLVKEVEKDYNHIQKTMKEYLNIVMSNFEAENHLIQSSEIEIICDSKEIFSFNYTNTLKRYVSTDVQHVHGSLEDEIILGIPYSEKIYQSEFMNLFKTTQSLYYSKNALRINGLGINELGINEHNVDMNIYFIGFAFGVADHYFFQGILDQIKYVERKGNGEVADINFYIYCHCAESKKSYINNFRVFLGEETFIRFSSKGKIKFLDYD